jgi:hypothetical protein
MTDYRALCAELLYAVQSHLLFTDVDTTTAQQRAKRVDDAMNAARAALAQPEPGVAGLFHWRNLGDGKPVQVRECPMCGIAPANVDDCGRFGDPACPYFGVGEPEPEGLTTAELDALWLATWSDETQQYDVAAFARAVIAADRARYARPAIEPVPVAERWLRAVAKELVKAEAKHPEWPTDPLHAIAIIGEEFGELTQAVLQVTYEPGKSLITDVQREAVQTAAMALRFLQSMDAYVYADDTNTHRQGNALAIELPVPGAEVG